MVWLTLVPVLSSTIASEVNIPHNFLSKIPNRLPQSELIIATVGAMLAWVAFKEALWVARGVAFFEKDIKVIQIR